MDPETFQALLSAAAAALQLARELASNKKHRSAVSGTDTRIAAPDESVAQHLRELSRWSEAISFHELLQSRRLRSSFVDLDLNLTPARLRGRTDPDDRTFKVSDLIKGTRHLVILGNPGAGKTTSMKKLLEGALEEQGEEEARFPLLLRFRRLSEGETVRQVLLRSLGIHLYFPETVGTGKDAVHVSEDDRREHETWILSAVLDKLRATVFLDGLDEAPPGSGWRLLDELDRIIGRTEDTRIVLTCRSAAFRSTLPGAQVLELAPLSSEQIHTFAFKWLGEQRGQALIAEISNSPYAGTEVLPLTLAHLCAIYERKGSVPRQPRLIYKTIVRLLVTDWDEQRRIRRHTDYEGFSVDQKEEFLEAVAFDLTLQGAVGDFDHSQLTRAYRKHCVRFGLPPNHEEETAREIESHTGLIIERGYSDYEFAHRAIQEYLTAQYLLKLPTPPWDVGILTAVAEPLAIAVALSSDPNRYLAELARRVVGAADKHQIQAFSASLIQRLVLEVPNFSPEPNLGAALVALMAEGHANDPRRPEQLPAFQSFMVFVETYPAVRDSLREFSRFYRAEPASESGRLVRLVLDEAVVEEALGVPAQTAFTLVLSSETKISSALLPSLRGETGHDSSGHSPSDLGKNTDLASASDQL